jgi:hypothetical protein
MEYVAPSNVGEFYLKHVEAMAAMEQQPERTSFGLAREGFSLALLRDLAEAFNVGKRAHVVIEWPTGFEVQRLPDGSNTKLFYRYLKGEEKEVSLNVDASEKLQEVLQSYLKLELDDCLKYDAKLTKEIKESRIISFAYIQRRLSNVIAFKNSPEGATKKLAACIAELVEQELLVAMPEAVTKEAFGTSAKLYKIV